MTSDRLPGLGEVSALSEEAQPDCNIVYQLWDDYLNLTVGIFSTEERAMSALVEYRRRRPIDDDQMWYWYTPYRLDSWMHGSEVIHEA
jgi:hypothetical protein